MHQCEYVAGSLNHKTVLKLVGQAAAVCTMALPALAMLWQ